MFCHVEGAEKALTVTTAEGNEQSRSNDAERDEAVSTTHLWERWIVNCIGLKDHSNIVHSTIQRLRCAYMLSYVVGGDLGQFCPNTCLDATSDSYIGSCISITIFVVIGPVLDFSDLSWESNQT